MQKFFLQMFAISQKINILTKLLRTFLATVMQILKQFGFLFQIQTCGSYLSCRGAPITDTLLATSLHFVKKQIFFYFCTLQTMYNLYL